MKIRESCAGGVPAERSGRGNQANGLCHLEGVLRLKKSFPYSSRVLALCLLISKGHFGPEHPLLTAQTSIRFPRPFAGSLRGGAVRPAPDSEQQHFSDQPKRNLGEILAW